MVTATTITPTQMDQALLELSVVETALPIHMMWLMAQSVVLGGYRLRPDITQRLNVGAAAPLAALGDNNEAIMRCAKEVDRLGQRLLHVLSPDKHVHGFYCCAMFNLLLLDEKFLDDPKSLGVLVSLVCIDDLKQFDHVEGYKYNEGVLKAEARRLLHAARQEGLYKFHIKDSKVIGDGPGSSLDAIG